MGSGFGDGKCCSGAGEFKGLGDVRRLRQCHGEGSVERVAGGSRVYCFDFECLTMNCDFSIPIKATTVAEFENDSLGTERENGVSQAGSIFGCNPLGRAPKKRERFGLVRSEYIDL